MTTATTSPPVDAPPTAPVPMGPVPSASGIDSVAMTLPDQWFTLPPSVEAFEATCAALVGRLRTDGFDDTELESCDALLSAQLADVRTGGAVFAAASFGLALPDGAAPERANLEALLATCTMRVIDAAALELPAPVTTALLFDAAAGTRLVAPGWTQVHPSAAAQHCALRVGDAIRRHALLRAPNSSDEPIRPGVLTFVESFLMPFGDTGQSVGVLSFATTNVTMSESLSRAFLPLAQSLTFFGPDDPTELPPPPAAAADGVATQPEPLAVAGLELRLVGSSGTAVVTGQPRVIGRGRSAHQHACDLEVDHPLVSRRHAQVWNRAGTVLCCDLGSRNGTLRVRHGVSSPVSYDPHAATTLRPGDALVTADNVLLARLTLDRRQ